MTRKSVRNLGRFCPDEAKDYVTAISFQDLKKVRGVFRSYFFIIKNNRKGFNAHEEWSEFIYKERSNGNLYM